MSRARRSGPPKGAAKTHRPGKSGTTLADDLRSVADQLGHTYMPAHEPSFWLRTRLVDLSCRFLPTCGHPGAILVTLWREMVICRDCLPFYRPEGDADFECDRCHAIERPIHVCTIVWHGFLVSWALCGACAAKEHGRG